MKVDSAQHGSAVEPEGARAPRRTPPALWGVLVGGAVLLVLYHGARFSALGPMALNDDLGLQHYLARITADGAIPLIDFEHGWNTAFWYFSAGLHLLSGGNPSVWAFLWGVVFGPLLAGLLLLAIAWRLRMPAIWTAALLASWVATVHLPHSKYAVPMAWVLVLLPTGVARRPPFAISMRVGMVATVFWFHAELAVLLGAGTAMYDVFGARDLRMGQRVARLAAVGAGLLLGVGSQVLVYAALGLPPEDTLRQVLIGQAGVYELQFDYPLGNPQSFRVLVYPVTLILPLVPVIWRRLSDPTRFVALLHLAQALIGIRRPGDGHVGAAATLLALLAVLAVRDLAAAPRPRLPQPAGPGGAAVAVGAVVLGGAWVVLALLAGFRIASFVAIVALCLVGLLGVAAARGGDRPWASLGAVLTALLFLAASLTGRTLVQIRDDAGEQQARAIAAVAGPVVERCAPEGEAWVVPGPLLLYETLGLDNPTPFYLFWYTFEAELDRVRAMVEAGDIPVIIQPYGWPTAMQPIVPFLEERYEVCDELVVEETGNLVRFWRHVDAGPDRGGRSPSGG